MVMTEARDTQKPVGLNFLVTPALRRRLRQVALDSDRTVADWVREAIEEKLERERATEEKGERAPSE